MAELDQPEREYVAEPVEPAGHARGGARHEQDRSGQKDRAGEHLRYQSGYPSSGGARDAESRGRIRTKLVHRDQNHRGRERQQIVDEAIRDQRGEQVRSGEVRLEQEYHDGLDDTETTWDMAHEAGELRDEKDAEEGEEAESVTRRQQHEERRARERPIERRHEELRPHDRGLGRWELPRADPDPSPPEKRPGGIHRDQQQLHGPDRTQRHDR